MKLSKNALIGIIAGGAAVLVAIIVTIVLLAGGGCKEHIDKNDDFLCDNCGKEFNDGLEVVTENVTFVVKMSDGQTLSGVGFSLTKDEEVIDLVSDANGKVTRNLVVGYYTLEFDYETIESSLSSNIYSVNVKQGMSEVVIILSDNTPDGSAEKPFYVADKETEIVLAPGGELHFNYRGASTKYLTINSDSLVVIYEGVEYTAFDGVIEVTVTPKEVGTTTKFVIKNVSDTTVAETMYFVALLGSVDNPYNLNEDDECKVVPADGTIYYQWTAYEDCVLVVFVPNHKNNSVGITKVLSNNVPISSLSAGGAYVYMPVCKDEMLTISVSTTNKQDTLVEFEGYFYMANDRDPLEFFIRDLDISFASGQSIVFTAEAGSTVTITEETQVSVVYNGTTYTPDENGKISFDIVAGCDTFTVTNNAEFINSILINYNGTLADKPHYGPTGGSNAPESSER